MVELAGPATTLVSVCLLRGQPSLRVVQQGMKALVTGGAGFIGSHLAEALCRRGVEVVVADDLSLGTLENLKWRRPGEALQVIQGDLADAEVRRQAVAGCDWVFHQAAIPSVPWSIAHPAESHRANLDVALGVFLAAREAGVKRVVFASSSAVYGDTATPEKRENDPPQPLSPYALQKYAAERYGQMLHEFHGFEVVSLLYFNVFGPRQSFDSPYSGVIAKFCTQALAGEVPTVFGDGRQTRDFIYVENAVDANLRAVEAPAGRVAGRVFNVAGGESVTLLDLLAELNRLTGRESVPLFAPARPGDVRASRADLAAAADELGWRVRVPWRAGLARTLAYYRSETAGG